MAEIRRMLTLSTGHLEARTIFWLMEGDITITPGRPSGGKGPFGWFLYAHDENLSYPSAPHAPAEEYPADLWACFVKARELGCDYVMFDSDVEPIDDLTTFEHWTG